MGNYQSYERTELMITIIICILDTRLLIIIITINHEGCIATSFIGNIQLCQVQEKTQ